MLQNSLYVTDCYFAPVSHFVSVASHRSFLTRHLPIGILRERSSSISAIKVTTFKSHTITSADFCAFSTAFGSGYLFQGIPRIPPRVPHASFSPSICHIYSAWFHVVIGLRLVMQPDPHAKPYMWFLFVRPEICPWLACSHIRLPSDFTSRWTPLPSAISFPLPGGFRTCTR